MKKINFEQLVKSKLNMLTISLDGMTQDTYQKYRRNGDVALVLNNIKELVAEKKR